MLKENSGPSGLNNASLSVEKGPPSELAIGEKGKVSSTSISSTKGSPRPVKASSTLSTPSRPKTAPSIIAGTPKAQTPSSRAPLLAATPKTPGGGQSARDMARIAKLQNTTEKVEKTRALKEKWAKEKEEHLKRAQEQRLLSAQKVQESNKVAAETRRKQQELQKAAALREKQAKAEELAASLEARVQLAKDLEMQAKQRKRMSIMLNKEILLKAQEKQTQIEKQQREAEEERLASRRLDYLQIREAKKAEEARRRESLAARGEELKKQRDIAASLAKKAAEEQTDIFQFRHQNWKDVQKATEKENQRSRESIAGRLDEWRAQKQVDMKNKADDLTRQQQSLEIRRQEWQDVENFKKAQMQRERKSIADRLEKWRQEKSIDARLKAEKEEEEEYEFLLLQQEIDGIKAFEANEKKARKQSLAYRLDKAKKDKDFEHGQEAIKAAIMEEERRIAELDRQDVLQYKQSLINARRQSLEYRNQTEYQERMRLQGEKQAAKAIDDANRELSEQAWRDVKAYQAKEREERRKSLANRLVESRKQNEIALELHRHALDAMHSQLESKRQDWLDIRAAKEEQRERSRKSIAFRIDSWRQQRLAETMLEAKKQYEAEEEARIREQDREDLELAKRLLKEKELEDKSKGGFIL